MKILRHQKNNRKFQISDLLEETTESNGQTDKNGDDPGQSNTNGAATHQNGDNNGQINQQA